MEGSEELQVSYQGQGQVFGTTHYFLCKVDRKRFDLFKAIKETRR